jgi:hypothetical protein
MSGDAAERSRKARRAAARTAAAKARKGPPVGDWDKNAPPQEKWERWSQQPLFRTCKIPGCANFHQARGLCAPHYVAMTAAGRLDEFPQLRGQNQARIRPIGHRQLDPDGYVTIKTAAGIRSEHRVVMEQMLGRPLLRSESVHHINGVRGDNRPENLELWHSLGKWKKNQPPGQRVAELIAYIAAFHADEMRAALDARGDFDQQHEESA